MGTHRIHLTGRHTLRDRRRGTVRRAHWTNQERTSFICTCWVPICLSFNSQQGPPLSSLSAYFFGWLVTWACRANTRDFCPVLAALFGSGAKYVCFPHWMNSSPPAQATWPDGGWVCLSHNITSVMIIVNATYTGRELSIDNQTKVIGVLEKDQNYQYLALYVSAEGSCRMG